MRQRIASTICAFGLTAAALANAEPPAEAGSGTLVATADSEYARLMAIARQQQTGALPHRTSLDITQRPSLGSRNAAVAIIEFGSFQCPYCRRHLVETMPQLKARYIDSGELLYVFYDIAVDPEHTHAQRAAEAAHCAAEQDRYWDFRERLYSNQKALAPPFLEAHAAAAGLDLSALHDCLDSDRYRDDVLAAGRLARQLRVRGTPTFFVGQVDNTAQRVVLLRRLSGAQPLDQFAAQIDALGDELAQVGPDGQGMP